MTASPKSEMAVEPSNEQPAVFTTEKLRFDVDGRTILHPLDLSFRAGEISGLIGHNGSGKSTLIKLLARQIQPSGGQVLFDGAPAGSYDARAFARAVAYLPQDTSSAAGMTVKELVASGRYPWHGALGRFTDLDREKVETALRLTHVDTLAGRMVDTLSGGERQRVWIAMLIAQDSRCLLLDEPTSALDIAHQMEVLGLVHELCRTKNLSAILVLHDINIASRFCDHLYALKAGRLIAAGPSASLMKAETLHAIYGADMGVTAHPVHGTPLAYVI
ncbi:ATP-binding cassette domain-containing protein [Agrobacterium rhizogenes]|uniref:ATP-binding cassette domain-containing protein n=2 Tax=Rhizobium rhizogenes TaxID=359 RepID=UPI0009B8BB1A|nr:ATP-binding cassette domain-containing protein [Rhizobium rhizogenes]MDJ1635536.1 ATP-binding cassette domain-containing protein [Rhizobium rhizogenes]NTF84093.1 ATP-binding cassette domain-containing protein [Rhizobium rhizogenes]NTG03426.1 ATP-binding cassette domain-containing protein [Rhizobium rhizogenes]NTG43949.1 ATP-binding cassette domain-containing protein [Rhizobium rhizogenes]NTG76495.1 ATP-binding cassette domain-containing protein [Rhizobium rhizogenes]